MPITGLSAIWPTCPSFTQMGAMEGRLHHGNRPTACHRRRATRTPILTLSPSLTSTANT